MKRTLPSLLVSLLLLVGCASDKYPHPPQFVAPTDLSERVLPAPPAKGSAEFEREIQFIVATQAKLTDAQKDVIRAEDQIKPEMILQSVMGPRYTREAYPALYSLLGKAASDAWRIGDANQDYWKSPRPWYADERVELIAPKITRYGYPSGHTTTNTVWAYTLSEVFPAHKNAFFARANEIARHRMEGGVHFPHDLKGGRALAKAIFTKMEASPAFQTQLKEAIMEVRQQGQKLQQLNVSHAPYSACLAAAC